MPKVITENDIEPGIIRLLTGLEMWIYLYQREKLLPCLISNKIVRFAYANKENKNQ